MMKGTKTVKVKAPKMKAAIKRRWVAALRSGKYKQSEGQLREVDYDNDRAVLGYCCLGVLCDVYANSKAGAHAKWKDEGFLGETTYLPTEVREWAGLPGEDEASCYKPAPGYHHETVQEALTTLNDVIGAGFKRIAAWIEKNL